MNIALLSADAQGQVDGTLMRSLYGPLCTHSVAQADVVAVPISFYPNEGSTAYRFNDDLKRLDKPWVMFDFCEYFCQGDLMTHTFGGEEESPIEHYKGDEWRKLHDFVQSNPPIVYFKRELAWEDRTKWLLPVEYPCSLELPPVQSREDFDARPFELFNCWGLSNHMRSWFHGEIFVQAGEMGVTVADSYPTIDHFIKHPEGRHWATIWTHHTQRRPIEQVMEYQWKAKVACSLPGAGTKCFRHGEAPLGNVMAMPWDDKAWGIGWKHGVNCIRFPDIQNWESVDELSNHIKELDLYEIYLNGQETAAQYQPERYVAEYIRPEIELAL